jgi:hypothetical protein
VNGYRDLQLLRIALGRTLPAAVDTLSATIALDASLERRR